MNDMGATLSGMKLALRDILVPVIDRVPFAYLDRARHAYFASSSGPQRYLLGLCMSVFRYRKMSRAMRHLMSKITRNLLPFGL